MIRIVSFTISSPWNALLKSNLNILVYAKLVYKYILARAVLKQILHYEGVFNEPTSDLTKLLARLVDSKNNILIPKWYSAVRHNTLTPALERLDALNPPEFTMMTYRETLGIPELRNEVRTFTSKQIICPPAQR